MRQIVLAVAVWVAGAAVHAAAPGEAEWLKASGVQAGLCVDLGPRDAGRMIALGKRGGFLVQGLASDAARVDAVREAIRQAGLYGRVSVELCDLRALPYADGLVNLVVAGGAKEQMDAGLTFEEILRVLAPMGVACLDGWAPPEGEGYEILKPAGPWTLVRKRIPAGADEWTHQHYGIGGNRVSGDTRAGPPHRLRWIAGVEWLMPDYSAKAMVVGGGRVFYVLNEASVRKVSWPYISARDAFSGVLLWKRAGEPNPLCMIATPAHLYLNAGEKLAALDAATGAEVRTFDEAPRPAWAMLAGERLLVSCQGGRELRCLDPKTGALHWKAEGRSFEPASGLANSAVRDGKIYFVERRTAELGCLDLASGKELWHAGAPGELKEERSVCLAACEARVLVVAGAKGIVACSTEDGRRLWSERHEVLGTPTRRKAKCYRDGFFIDGLYWIHVGDLDPTQPEKYRYERGRRFSWQGLDPLTGEVRKTLPYPEGMYVGASCFPDQASERYFMGGYSSFVEVATGKHQPRGNGFHSSCGIGVRLAYGLVYNSALYMPGRFLQGDMAVEGQEDAKAPAPGDPARLEKGAEYDASREPAGRPPEPGDWPVYRHDALRTSRSSDLVPGELAEIWAADAGGNPSAPTVADGRVFVASAEEHRVSAFDAKSGRMLWSFTAGGRVKVPPTVAGGLCYFGAADGYAYCLEATRGKLVWRFQAARTPRRIVARERVESTWPVEEGVLVQDGLACFTAGRHGEVDGGMDLYALKAATGEFVWHKKVEGSMYPPLPVSDGKTLALTTSWRCALRDGAAADPIRLPDNANSRSVLRPTYVLGQDAVFSFRLRAVVQAGDVVVAAGRPAGDGVAPQLTLRKPAGGEALVANAPDAHPLDKSSAPANDWRWWAFSAKDGRTLSEGPLPAMPAWDGMAAGCGRIYLTTADGNLRCLGRK